MYFCNLNFSVLIMKKVTIFLSEMKFYAYHGCFEEEQSIGTHFTVDATLTYDAEKAIADDDVEKAVNYQLVYKTIEKVMNNPQHLIETVADKTIKSIKEEFPEVIDVKVVIRKLNPPLDGKTDFVAVELEG